MYVTANCRTIAIMHRHQDSQISIDRILYTQDSKISCLIIVRCLFASF